MAWEGITHRGSIIDGQQDQNYKVGNFEAILGKKSKQIVSK
jgi:hypothetical protein